MEEKLVAYLQKLLDEYVDANVHEYCWAKEIADAYNACKDMTEAVTGKRVTTHNWVVALEDEIPGIEVAKA